MSFRHGWVAIVAAALVSSGIVAPAASASAPAADVAISPRIDNGTWALTGTLTAPARSAASSVTVSLSGSIEVTQGVLDLAACTSSSPAQARPFLRNTATSGFTSIDSAVASWTAPGSATVSTTSSVAPGSYELVMRYRCGSTAGWSGQVSASPAVSVTIATLVSRENLTLACVAASFTVCPSSSSTSISVPSGYSVRFGAVSRFTWSDGVVTEERPTGSQELKYTYSWSSFWYNEAYSCETTVSVSSTYRYRCEAGGTIYNELTVTPVDPTSNYEISLPQINPSAALSGTTAAVTATVSREYSDGSKWPAPVGTSYTLEFLASQGSYSWSQLGSSRTTSEAGTIVAAISISQSGKLRIRVSSSTSPEADITLLTRSGRYQLATPTGPSSATPGTSVSITGAVLEELSNGTTVAPLNSVSFDLEFAIAYSPTATDLTWTKVGSGSTSGGNVVASATAQYSGMYRLRKDDRVSPPVYVPVTGSSPITVTGSITPVTTEVPFVGVRTRFSVNAQMSGYVGTETLLLDARVGDGEWVSVGSITTSSTILGVYPLPNPSQWGETPTTFRVRDPRGLVVGSGSGASVFVDGIKSYRPKLAAPSRLYLPGETVRFSATLAAVTHLDRELPATWSGSASLQRSDGAVWRPVRVVMSARGNLVTLESEAVLGATYRVESSFAATASEPIIVGVSRGAPKLEVSWPETVKISAGLRVSAYVQLSEGQRWAGTSPVQLQFRAPNSTRWIVKARKTMSDGRNVSMTAARPTAGCYRVIIPAYGIENYAGYGVKSCTADPSA